MRNYHIGIICLRKEEDDVGVMHLDELQRSARTTLSASSRILLAGWKLLHKEYKFEGQVPFMSRLEIIQSLIDNIPVLSVSGKIDAVTSRDLESALIGLMDQNKKFLVVNMEKVEFLSSSGLRVLMASLNRLKHKDGDLKLAALQPFVKEVFVLTGANRFFSIYPSQGEAIESLRS
jgi:anti-sigma B factor antagonist